MNAGHIARLYGGSERDAKRIHVQPIMLNFYDGFPVQLRRVLNEIDFRLGGAVKDDVEPVILFEALSGFVFICRERYLAHRGSTFDLDEANFDGGL